MLSRRPCVTSSPLLYPARTWCFRSLSTSVPLYRLVPYRTRLYFRVDFHNILSWWLLASPPPSLPPAVCHPKSLQYGGHPHMEPCCRMRLVSTSPLLHCRSCHQGSCVHSYPPLHIPVLVGCGSHDMRDLTAATHQPSHLLQPRRQPRRQPSSRRHI